MFKANLVIPEYRSLLGWRQHHETDEINLPANLTETQTGEYYQQKHPALKLETIQSLIPSNMDLDAYLEKTVQDSTVEIFNDLLQYRQLNQYGKTLLDRSTLLNRHGWLGDVITNQNRFVGFQVRVKALEGLQVLINNIGIQFSGSESFKLYLFHTNKKLPLKELDVVTDGNGAWKWTQSDFELSSFSGVEYQGGVFIIGYYQEDLQSNAINYSNFNWDKGECSSCNNKYAASWTKIRKHFFVYPIYVAQGNFTKGEMFDLNSANYVNDQSWGLNLQFTVLCDLTNFFIQNKFVFKNLLALKVTTKILGDMKFSNEINNIEENVKNMIIRDLEGDIDTKLTNLPTQYSRELKSVSFNVEGINGLCLGCKSDAYAPNIGHV
tara:strand:- start:843 stop:1982 length:1140 start_codon:yes stop_codon:yes gene_type:complete